MTSLNQGFSSLGRKTLGTGLEKPELDLVQMVIKCRPLRTYMDIKENIEVHSTATASISTIGRAVPDRLPEEKMTWKKLMRPASEKFTPDHIAYCQSYINFMCTLDHFALNFWLQIARLSKPEVRNLSKGTTLYRNNEKHTNVCFPCCNIPYWPTTLCVW